MAKLLSKCLLLKIPKGPLTNTSKQTPVPQSHCINIYSVVSTSKWKKKLEQDQI